MRRRREGEGAVSQKETAPIHHRSQLEVHRERLGILAKPIKKLPYHYPVGLKSGKNSILFECLIYYRGYAESKNGKASTEENTTGFCRNSGYRQGWSHSPLFHALLHLPLRF
jgi:hypothetical protein